MNICFGDCLDFLSFISGLLALLIALFIPGYFLCLGFFPVKKDLSKLERIVFSFVFSIAFLPLLILFENLLLKIAIDFYSVLGSVVLLILIGLALYLLRAGFIPLPEKASRILKTVERNEAFPLLPIK